MSTESGTLHVQSVSKLVQAGQMLPRSYMWNEGDCPTIRYDEYQDEQVPVIDLTCKDTDIIRSEIMNACKEWGAFQVINHGIDYVAIDRARAKAIELFSCPLEEKLLARRLPDSLFGYGASRMACLFDSLMWSECFTMKGSPNENIRDFASILWRDDKNEFCDVLKTYDDSLRRLASKLLRLIVEGLGDNAKYESTYGLDEFLGILHFNHYPKCSYPMQTMGLAAHTDSSFLTILNQGNVGGLQIRKGNSWVAIKPLDNAFVVQVGDMLQILSNGRLMSALHRAVVNEKHERLSLVYFASPPTTSVVVPIIGSMQSAVYRPLTWGEYLQAKTQNIFGAMERFKI